MVINKESNSLFMNLLLLKIRELILIIDIPIIPPKVFIIMSVMSETPMCRIY